MRDFSEKLTAEIEEPEPPQQEPAVTMPASPADGAGTYPTGVTTATPSSNGGGAKRYWNWMALI